MHISGGVYNRPLKVIGNIFKVIMSSGLSISAQGSGGNVYRYSPCWDSWARHDCGLINKEGKSFFLWSGLSDLISDRASLVVHILSTSDHGLVVDWLTSDKCQPLWLSFPISKMERGVVPQHYKLLGEFTAEKHQYPVLYTWVLPTQWAFCYKANPVPPLLLHPSSPLSRDAAMWDPLPPEIL